MVVDITKRETTRHYMPPHSGPWNSYENSKLQTVGNCLVEITLFFLTNKLQGKTERGKRKTNRLKDTKDSNHPAVKVVETGW